MNLKRIKCLLILIILSVNIQAQRFERNWEQNLASNIIASPVIDNNIIYLGTENGVFYALEESTGKIKWKKDTKGNIRAKAIVIENLVFFESANVFYALNKSNGKELWINDRKIKAETFEYKGKKYNYKLDPYDDMRSSPVLYENIIYIGTTDGKLIGFNFKNGSIGFSISTKNNSPIRSSPLIENDRLYFGDWNGIIYCYDLNKKAYQWTKRTYRYKEYRTFGGIVSDFVIQDSLLLFGARNQMLNALHIEKGEKEWTFSDKDNGWIIGDPKIYKDTLYIGGSDNFSMYAIEPWHGQMLWKHNGGKNIYTKPIVTNDWVIYTCGNAYKYKEEGVVYLLNRKTGVELTKFITPNGIFSSPVFTSTINTIVFGSYDGKIRSLRIDK